MILALKKSLLMLKTLLLKLLNLKKKLMFSCELHVLRFLLISVGLRVHLAAKRVGIRMISMGVGGWADFEWWWRFGL